MEWQLESLAARTAASLSGRGIHPLCYIRAGQRLTHQITTPWASLSLAERERERETGERDSEVGELRSLQSRWVVEQCPTGLFWIGFSFFFGEVLCGH